MVGLLRFKFAHHYLPLVDQSLGLFNGDLVEELRLQRGVDGLTDFGLLDDSPIHREQIEVANHQAE